MKNEDRIVELLSEQVKRLDKHEELLRSLVTSVNNLADVFEKKFDQVNDHEKRIHRLEDKLLN